MGNFEKTVSQCFTCVTLRVMLKFLCTCNFVSGLSLIYMDGGPILYNVYICICLMYAFVTLVYMSAEIMPGEIICTATARIGKLQCLLLNPFL